MISLRKFIIYSLGAVFGAASLARADVSLGSIFTDHAVLQRDRPIPIWGRADAGEAVTVSFRDASETTTADSTGRWAVLLPAQHVGPPGELQVRGSRVIVLKDVLVGDVWLCAGQSNLEFPLAKADNAAAEIAAAQFPNLRQFAVAYAATDEPSDHINGQWVRCSPETVARFSAVGYFFARRLEKSLEVPIGIINASVGGSAIEAWTPANAISEDAAALARSDAMALRRVANRPRLTPSVLYNGMIAPLDRYAVRGVVWYQGENNANARSIGRATGYAALFSHLIRSWRDEFHQGQIPFYFVQLPNYRTARPDSERWAIVRAAQAETLREPATAMAVTIDVGDPGSLHSTHKQPVGERLAALALHYTYGRDAVSLGPVPVREHFDDHAFEIEYDQAVAVRPTPVPQFEIAGRDGRYVPANVRLEGKSLILSAPSVVHPAKARYAWSNSPVASVFNTSGWPAAPFQYQLPQEP